MLFSPFERMLALRYLRPRQSEGFISVIAGFSLTGIALGVATLIVVMAVMNGFRQELLGRILGLNGHVGVYGHGGQLTEFTEMLEQIRTVPGVVRATPTIEGQVMASSASGAVGAMVRGVTPEDLVKREVVMKNFNGNFNEFTSEDSVVIGYRLGEKLGLRIGDNITLISPKGSNIAFGMIPRMKTYKIVGTFNIGMFEYDSSFIFMPMQAAQIYFKLPHAVTHIEIMLENPDLAMKLRGQLFLIVGDTARLYDWQQANASFFNAVQVERNVMFLILTLIILVAAFNIISSLIMLVKDKGRAIAILRTMGASRVSVMKIFFLSGASIGVMGTALGVGLGLSFALNIESIRQFLESLSGRNLFAAEIYFLSKLPAKVDTAEVLTVALMALGLSFAATIYPAWRAARLDPVEALRHE